MRLSPGTEVVAFGVAGAAGVRDNSGRLIVARMPARRVRDTPNHQAVHSVFKLREFARIRSPPHPTGDVATKTVGSQRHQNQIKSRQKNKGK